MGALTYISFLLVFYNIGMFILEGGWDNPLARRVIYLFVCCILFLAQMGFIQIQAISAVMSVIDKTMSELEQKTVALNEELQKKYADAKVRFSTAKKKGNSSSYDE